MKLGPEIVTVAYPKLRDECAIRPAGKQCVGNRSSYSARMVDGNSEHVAPVWRKIDLSGDEKKTRFVTVFGLIERLEQIK